MSVMRDISLSMYPHLHDVLVSDISVHSAVVTKIQLAMIEEGSWSSCIYVGVLILAKY